MGKTGRRALVALVSITGAVTLALLAAEVALDSFLDAEYVEERLAAALDEAGGVQAYRVRVEAVDPDVLSRSIRIRGFEITTGAKAVEARAESGGSPADVGGAAVPGDGAAGNAPSIDVRVPELVVRGLAPIRWIRGGGYGARSVRIDGPRITVWTEPDPRRGPGAAEDAGSEPGEATLAQRLAGALPTLALDVLRVDSADFVRSVRGAGPAGRHHLRGVSAELRDVQVDSAAALDRDRVLFARELRLQVGGYTYLSPDSLTRVRVNALRTATDGCLQADSVTLRPAVDMQTFLRRVERRKDLVDAFAGPVSACALDHGALLGRRAVVAGRIAIDSFDVGVYTDRRLPPPPEGAAWRPHTLIRGGPPIAIDSITARGGRIEYAERAPDSDSAGVFSLEEIDLRILGLYSADLEAASGPDGATAPAEGAVRSGPRTAEVRMDARLMGAASTRSTLELALGSDALRFRYRGNVGTLDGTALNEVLLPLTGIEIRSGRMDTAWFDYRVNGDAASGEVVPLYRDLDIAIVGDDEAVGLIETLKSLLADARIAERNPSEEGEDARIGTVDYTVKRTDPFFTLIWMALRSGLMDAIGM